MSRRRAMTARALAAWALLPCAMSCGTASLVSTSDSVRVRVSVVREWVPVEVSVPLPVVSESRAVRDTVDTLSNAYAVSVAEVRRDGTLRHSLATRPATLTATAWVPAERRDSVVYREREVRVEVPVEREPTRWQAFRLRWFGTLCALLAALLAWTLRKPLLRLARRLA